MEVSTWYVKSRGGRRRLYCKVRYVLPSTRSTSGKTLSGEAPGSFGSVLPAYSRRFDRPSPSKSESGPAMAALFALAENLLSCHFPKGGSVSVTVAVAAPPIEPLSGLLRVTESD